MKGLFGLFSGERNIKMQILISAIVVFFAFLSKISEVYILIIAVIFFLGIVLELVNTNVEKLIDIISPEYNKQLGKIKDSMAGIVLLTFIVAMIISTAVLYNSIIPFWVEVSKHLFSVITITANVILLLIIFIVVYVKNKN